MELAEFFETNRKCALAFSGGVDSVYLLYAAVKAGIDVTAYYVKTAFQPAFEFEDAKRISEELKARMVVIDLDVLQDTAVTDNPANRCYFCKQKIFTAILEKAHAEGYEVVLDGTNASDDEGDRPGMRALKELQVKSPLRLCGLTKDMIRRLSKEAGLFTWDKPAYACLATRIATGEVITAKKLETTEHAEDFLMKLGFRDFRVRMIGEDAKIQVTREDFRKLADNSELIYEELKKHYRNVYADMKART